MAISIKALPEHMQRVVTEKQELDDRIQKLTSYTTAGCPKASEKEGVLLNRQLQQMQTLSATLQERLDLYA